MILEVTRFALYLKDGVKEIKDRFESLRRFI